MLLVLGAFVTLLGLVALPLTDPASAGDARLWAVSSLLSGIVFVAVALVVRSTPAPAPITRPRRSLLWVGGFTLIWLVGLALIDSDRDWTFYVWGGGLVTIYAGTYVYEWLQVRRRREDEAGASQSGSEAAQSGSMDGPRSALGSTPPAD